MISSSKKYEPLPPGEIGQFEDAEGAYRTLCELYDNQINYLRQQFTAFLHGDIPAERISVTYPYVSITIDKQMPVDARKSYGFLPGLGRYKTTVTQPEAFPDYYRDQFELLLANHKVPLEIGVSDDVIPIHFALGDNVMQVKEVTPDIQALLPHYFDQPDLYHIDDTIVNGAWSVRDNDALPLALFTAPRVDLSMQRLKHYSATSPKHFQNFVMFTNYQFYVDEFVKTGRALMEKTTDPALLEYGSQYTAFVEPGEMVTYNQNLLDKAPEGEHRLNLPQMPAYHLKRADDNGITLVNIGVGPSNAKTITDHIAVLRPHVWLMLGHCAGLRAEQNMGDYVLAHGYVRDDHVLDEDLPPWVPLPALAEVQLALQQAVSDVTGLKDFDLKRIMRTGTVATVDDRNWELQPQASLIKRFNQSRAIALDMESATISANGFRYRVPYGTLLCVSDKPLHGALKLPGMAHQFYRQRVAQHLQIGIRAMELLRAEGPDRLHSRKLRSFVETAFR